MDYVDPSPHPQVFDPVSFVRLASRKKPARSVGMVGCCLISAAGETLGGEAGNTVVSG